MLYKYESPPPNPPFGANQRRMCEEVGIDRCACVHLREGWGSKCSDLIIIYSQRENEFNYSIKLTECRERERVISTAQRLFVHGSGDLIQFSVSEVSPEK